MKLWEVKGSTWMLGVEAYVHSWLQTRPTSFYEDGISKLPIRWEKCVLKAGEYVEK
jgi:hypothetical protein